MNSAQKISVVFLSLFQLNLENFAYTTETKTDSHANCNVPL